MRNRKSFDLYPNFSLARNLIIQSYSITSRQKNLRFTALSINRSSLRYDSRSRRQANSSIVNDASRQGRQHDRSSVFFSSFRGIRTRVSVRERPAWSSRSCDVVMLIVDTSLRCLFETSRSSDTLQCTMPATPSLSLPFRRLRIKL